jgi:uncharacterized protein
MKWAMTKTYADFTDTLCLQCGLCCNGVLFADVRREGDDPSPLFAQHGPRVPQPCPAFDAATCQCALYAERPARCRKFECKQFIAVRAGVKTPAGALKKITEARRLAAEMERLLTELGFNNARLPFSKRFQRCQKAAESREIPGDAVDCLAELQMTVHRLNLLLAQEFYA